MGGPFGQGERRRPQVAASVAENAAGNVYTQVPETAADLAHRLALPDPHLRLAQSLDDFGQDASRPSYAYGSTHHRQDQER